MNTEFKIWVGRERGDAIRKELKNYETSVLFRDYEDGGKPWTEVTFKEITTGILLGLFHAGCEHGTHSTAEMFRKL